MEEIEVPTEHLQEAIKEKTEESNRERWALQVALSTAIMAVLAAIAGLLSGHHVNEAMIDQIKASDQWAYYQAKGIKAEVASSSARLMEAITSRTAPGFSQDSARYRQEQDSIRKVAEMYAEHSASHLQKHITLSKSVTIFQVAIAISAIAILTRKRMLWYAAMLLTLAGSFFLLLGNLV
ncbi:MAG TPA: DUF4337 domain-containing protein [Chitinophagaceae bacterium]|nr:DUF4337 domain-containing protein [Chitinophagaceae bacterium]